MELCLSAPDSQLLQSHLPWVSGFQVISQCLVKVILQPAPGGPRFPWWSVRAGSASRRAGRVSPFVEALRAFNMRSWHMMRSPARFSSETDQVRIHPGECLSQHARVYIGPGKVQMTAESPKHTSNSAFFTCSPSHRVRPGSIMGLYSRRKPIRMVASTRELMAN